MVARLVTRVGAWGLTLFATLFGLFAAGYAFEDPGGWAAVGLVAAYVLPATALALVAWRWPERATTTVVPAVGVVALAWMTLPLYPETVRAWFDDVGPVFALATGVVAIPLAVLGLHRPGLAGTTLVGFAGFVFVQLVLATDAWHEGPGPTDLLGTSGGVMLVPMALSGALLLIAHLLRRHRPGAPAGGQTPP